MPSGIAGYGKGKVLEKHVCTNCLRKGVECEWDKGGRGKSEIYIYIYIFDFTQNTNRQVLPAMSETEDPMHAWRIGALIVEEATYGGGTDSEASKEAEIRASSSHSGSEEAQDVPQAEAELFVPRLNGKPHQDSYLRDGEAKGG